MAVRAPRTPEQNRAIVIGGLRAAADQYEADQTQAYSAIGGETTKGMNRVADQFGRQAMDARGLAMILEEGEENGDAQRSLFGDTSEDRAWSVVRDIMAWLETPSVPAHVKAQIHEVLRTYGFKPENEITPEYVAAGLAAAAVRAGTDEFPRTCILTGAPGEDSDDCTTHNHEDRRKPGWQEARDVAFQHRDLEQPGIRFAGDSGWSAWVPPRGLQDYEGGTAEGAILDGYGETFWSTAAEAGAHIDAMAKKDIEVRVILYGEVNAVYKDGKVTEITFTPPNVADASDAVDEVCGDDDLDVSDEGPFWKATREFLHNHNGLIEWVE